MGAALPEHLVNYRAVHNGGELQSKFSGINDFYSFETDSEGIAKLRREAGLPEWQVPDEIGEDRSGLDELISRRGRIPAGFGPRPSEVDSMIFVADPEKASGGVAHGRCLITRPGSNRVLCIVFVFPK